MEFSDIDASTLFDWSEEQPPQNTGNDNDGQFSENELTYRFDQADQCWDPLYLPMTMADVEEDKHNDWQCNSNSVVYSFPNSHESIVPSTDDNDGDITANTNAIHHPLAMSSLSRCPPHTSTTFPWVGNSNNTSCSVKSSGMDIDDLSGGVGGFNAPTSAVASLNGHVSCYTDSLVDARCLGGGSYNIHQSSQIESNHHTKGIQHPFLPSWNDSLGDMMYSSLFNVGATASRIGNNTANTGSNQATNNYPPSIHSFPSIQANMPPNSSKNLHHYGMAINGFHPQLNAQFNPILPHNEGNVCVNRASTGSPGTVKTSNACESAVGHAYTSPTTEPQMKTAKERNEREQLRAKKITGLIQELRENMQNEGWKEEMKSKYDTLSQCKAYVEYLRRSHKEKEAEIEHTRKKLIKEKASLEARSDPDSASSSLTASTARSTSPEEESGSSDKESSSSSDNLQCQPQYKNRRKINFADVNTGTNKNFTSDLHKTLRESVSHSHLKRKFPPSAEFSSEDDVAEGPGGKNISFNKTNSSVSDMTDSQRSSIDRTIKGKQPPPPPSSQVKSNDGSIANKAHTTGSISSTAVVVRGSSQKLSEKPCDQSLEPRREEEKAMNMEDVVDKKDTKEHKKKKRRRFEYDYKAVFLKSNVPQLIATLSGRIVVWNDFFLTSTGLSEHETKSLTIFSIVDPTQLSNLYKFVSNALADTRKTNISTSSDTHALDTTLDSLVHTPSPESDSPAQDTHLPEDLSWQAITLKCVRFTSKKNKEETIHPNPLYLTIALMSDEDREQRCFHCVMTDCPGTNTTFGSVSPELLANLFAPREKGGNVKDGVD